jgi:hypothetical protein
MVCLLLVIMMTSYLIWVNHHQLCFLQMILEHVQVLLKLDEICFAPHDSVELTSCDRSLMYM